MAPRTIWKGALGFGLVSVPVGLFPATQDKSIHFNQFEEGTSDRIRYKKVNERTGKEVSQDRIVKGVDLGAGEYVILNDDELAAAEPERSRSIEITDFVDLDAIDPIYYRTTYFLAPEGKGSDKPYALLRRVMRESNKVAIATLVMRNKEYLVAIRPEGDMLALETMFFSDEVRSPESDFPAMPDDGQLTEREISMAQLLVESMEAEWDPERYHDTHREKVEALVDEKRQGHTIEVQSEVGGSTAKVVDLMEALNASIRGAASGSSSKTFKRAAAAKAPAPAKKPAKKAPAKRAPAKPAAKAPARRRAS
ncbi:MAG TPA: Ku protein [Acidimicrobiales bacterium]|jgi:DNA end-binding protein Ku|nr:Ku protein [Acidimicrobiales bacterium]